MLPYNITKSRNLTQRRNTASELKLYNKDIIGVANCQFQEFNVDGLWKVPYPGGL